MRTTRKKPHFLLDRRGWKWRRSATRGTAARASARRTGFFISGEHGSGKTALCDAFGEHRRSTPEGRCASATDKALPAKLAHEPDHPFLDALIALDRRHPGSCLAPSVSTRRRGWRTIRIGSAPAYPMGAHGAPVDWSPPSAALAALSHDLPLILVLEDLQWADVDTVNTLARLAESHVPSKLLIIGTCAWGEWTAGERAHQRLLAVSFNDRRSLRLTLGALTLEARRQRRCRRRASAPGSCPNIAPAVHASPAAAIPS